MTIYHMWQQFEGPPNQDVEQNILKIRSSLPK